MGFVLESSWKLHTWHAFKSQKSQKEVLNDRPLPVENPKPGRDSSIPTHAGT